MFEEMSKQVSLELQYQGVKTRLTQQEDIKTLCRLMSKEKFCEWCLDHSGELKLSQKDIDILTRYMLDQRKITLQAKEITSQQVKGLKQLLVGNMNLRKKDKKEIDKFIEIYDELVKKGDNIQRIILGLNVLEDFNILEILSKFLVEVSK